MRIIFLGTVQGVGFRATAQHLASAFAVSGWVRNQPDRTVLMEVQGLPAEVERYLAALRERMSRFIKSEQPSAVARSEGEVGFHIRG